MKTYKGSHFRSPFCLLILGPGLILSSGTLRDVFTEAYVGKAPMSKSRLRLCLRLLKRLLILQGVLLHSRGGGGLCWRPRAVGSCPVPA